MRRDHWGQSPEFALPVGDMRPIGYLMQQHGVQLLGWQPSGTSAYLRLLDTTFATSLGRRLPRIDG